MKRTPLERRTELKRTGPIKPKRRKPSEFDRIYGSNDRAWSIRAMPCAVPLCHDRRIHNAHTENGGVGRKAGWETVVPLCAHHHAELDNGLGSVDLFDAKYGTDLRALAARLATEVQP